MKQKGFTLIELVVVIVILGILSVTAAPKFLNLQSDAKISALKGAKGAIEGANGIVYGKAVLAGIENTHGQVGDELIDTIGGNIVMTKDNLLKAVSTDMEIKEFEESSDNASALAVFNKGHADTQCLLQIVNDHVNKQLHFELITTEC
ncbi:type II secretion system protein [Vibrio panuliri]|nr:type II secretion system protein [Vibrio panuliri]KAB1460867.1 type II secretion system protein [Vibrio panuliri]